MNRPKIIELSPELSNMIAAGEVVERPMSVVKELVENSIDAFASVVRIDLMNSGLDKISVTDNGLGMTADDIDLAIKPHATSKIKLASDLFSISTLGFRGEALPSIASISKMTITSSINGYEGCFKRYHAGKIVEEGKTSFPKGTKIEVTDIFFNTPARYKNLSSEQVELSHIVGLVNKFSMIYPEISFILTNNTKILFSTDGSNNFDLIISEIYGTDTAKHMIRFEGHSSLYKISGYTSSNSVYRSNKNAIVVMINKRLIKNQNLVYAITDAYKTYLPIGKYPVTILEIDADPSYVDVNVHPTKQEVRFTDERELRYLITKTISEALNSVNMVYSPSVNQNVKKVETVVNEPIYKEEYKTKKQFSWDDFEVAKPIEKDNYKVEEKESYVEQVSEEDEFSYEFPNNYEEKIVEEEKYIEQSIEFKEEKEQFFSNMNYIGQYNKTYLLLEKNDNLYLIDQHAAMERVMYEKILNSFRNTKNDSYELMIPLKVELSNDEIRLLENKSEELIRLGIDFDLFGQNTIVIRSLPLWVIRGHEREFVYDIIDGLLNDKSQDRSVVYDELAKLMSCKKSIKANMSILYEEVNALLNDLDHCVNPYTCPHGRPTVVNFSKYDIEKLFKRVM